MQYLLTGEFIPVKNVFTAKALLDSSPLHYLQKLWNLKNRRGTSQTHSEEMTATQEAKAVIQITNIPLELQGCRRIR